MRRRTKTVRSGGDAGRIGALTSPVRIEMIGILQTHGPSSIRELAASLGRPADGLYHHVRTLLRAGILAESTRRKVGRREEVVYRLTAPRIEGHFDPSSPASRGAVLKSAAAALRMANREFAAALAAGEAPCAGDAPRLRASRQKVWLTDAALHRLKDLLRRVDRFLTQQNERREGSLYVLTTVLTPLPRVTRKRV
jgi:predicted ArsR family transcriptional regulator